VVGNLYRSNPNPVVFIIKKPHLFSRRSQRPHGQRRRSTAARLLRPWVRIPLGAWMSLLWVLRVVR